MHIFSKLRTPASFLSPLALTTALVAAVAPLPVQASPRVFVVNEQPNDNRGVLKLARYHGSSAQAAGSTVVVTTHYEDLCTAPCGDTVNVEENPIFFFVRDGNPVSHGFRLPKDGTVTVSVRPTRKGMYYSGFMLTGLFILPVGIPLLIAGRPKVSIADGPPSDGQIFRKLKKART